MEIWVGSAKLWLCILFQSCSQLSGGSGEGWRGRQGGRGKDLHLEVWTRNIVCYMYLFDQLQLAVVILFVSKGCHDGDVNCSVNMYGTGSRQVISWRDQGQHWGLPCCRTETSHLHQTGQRERAWNWERDRDGGGYACMVWIFVYCGYECMKVLNSVILFLCVQTSVK